MLKGRIKKDITVRFIPNILIKEGRTLQSFPYDRRWTIRRYLKKAQLPFEDMRISVNGRLIKNIHQHLQSGDEISLSPHIEGVQFFQWVFAIAQVAMTAYSIYQAVTASKVKMPSYDTEGSGLDDGSPSASWTGAKTVREPNGSIPIIYGRRLTGGTVINEFISTDGEKNYLNSLVAICEGPIKSITLSRINKNAAANFTNYTEETRLGTGDQEPIKNFEDLHDIKSLSIKLDKNEPYTYTSTISDLEAFEVLVRLPSGIYQQDSSGTFLSWAATFKVEYKLHTDPDWIDLGETTISGKTSSVIQKIFRKDGLTAGQYDIRITKTSEDPSDLTYPITIGELYLTGIDEINTDELAYPYTALDGLETLAIDELQGDEPNYEFITEGKLVSAPKIMNGAAQVDWEDYYWDPDTEQYKLLADDTVLSWDGTTYVEQFCANPIWCLYDLTTNTRYGLGDYITTSDHDLDFLLEKSRYCEERVSDGEGGYEKRFRMDVCIDSPQSALDLIMSLATIFRGLPFYSDNGKIKIDIDKPADPVQLFGMGNIIKDSFSQTWGSRRDIPNIVHVQFDNEDNYYEQEMISVVDEESLAAGDPKRIKQIRYYGTKLSYAIRFGRDYIKTAKYTNRTISISSGMGAFIRQCGEVIDIAHDVPQWGYSGVVQAGSTTTKVKIDRTVIIESGKSYAIRVDSATGAYEEKVVTDAPGSYTEVTVSEAFSFTPAKDDFYSFGELNKIVLPARIMSLKRKRLGEVEIQAQEYNEDKYDETAVVIPVKKTSSLNINIPDVENLTLTERLVKLKDGTIEDVIDVWFSKPDTTNYILHAFDKARIYISDDDGASWTYLGETQGTHFAIEGGIKDLYTYTIAVTTVSSNGHEEKAIAASPQAEITIIGKSAPPADVSSLSIEQLEDQCMLTWPSVDDVDLKGYELRKGTSWETGIVVDTIFDGTKYRLSTFGPGLNQFFIKAIDTSGNYSLNAASASILITRRPGVNLVAAFYGQDNMGRPDEIWIDETIQQIWRNLYNTAYNRICLMGKSTNRWDTWEMSWEEAEAGDYEYDYPIAVGEYPWVAGIYDFGVVLENVMLTYNMFWLSDEKMVSLVEYRYSTDGITWTDWKLYSPGFITARYVQFRGNIIAYTAYAVAVYFEANSFLDLADVQEFISNQDIAIGGTYVYFSRSYIVVPTIVVTTISASSPLVPILSPAYISQVGFHCILRNSETQAFEAGKINALVKGY